MPNKKDQILVEELARAICKAYTAGFDYEFADFLDEARAILPILHRERAAAHAAGVAWERADVVAWLRTEAGRIDDLNRHVDAHLFADAIERGQHKEPGK